CRTCSRRERRRQRAEKPRTRASWTWALLSKWWAYEVDFHFLAVDGGNQRVQKVVAIGRAQLRHERAELVPIFAGPVSGALGRGHQVLAALVRLHLLDAGLGTNRLLLLHGGSGRLDAAHLLAHHAANQRRQLGAVEGGRRQRRFTNLDGLRLN